MSRRYRSRRRLRDDVLQLALVACCPLAVVLAFPFAELTHCPPASRSGKDPACAFVTLTPETERRAVALSKASWQSDRSSVRRLRADLFIGQIPKAQPQPVFGVGARMRSAEHGTGQCQTDLMPASMASPAPLVLPTLPAETPAGTFSREEMLSLRL